MLWIRRTQCSQSVEYMAESTLYAWLRNELRNEQLRVLAFWSELGSSKWCSAGCWTLFASRSSSHAHTRRATYVSSATCRHTAAALWRPCRGSAWSVTGY